MIIDSKGKLFGKISIIDIVIVLIVIIAVAGIGYKFTKSNTGNAVFTKQSDIQIKFQHDDLPDFVVNAIKVGDPVRESVQNASFGRVVDIETGDAIIWLGTEEGESVKVSREGYHSVLITMNAKGTMDNLGVTIDKANYYVGQTITLYVGNAAVYSGRITEITVKE